VRIQRPASSERPNDGPGSAEERKVRPPGEAVWFAVEEFWIPRSNERADVATIGSVIEAFEIKSDRDSLKRPPRQVIAYGRVFSRSDTSVGRTLGRLLGRFLGTSTPSAARAPPSMAATPRWAS